MITFGGSEKNVNYRPREYWDYEAHVVEWGNQVCDSNIILCFYNFFPSRMISSS